MRIVIAGPPKSGNVWLKCILANIYGLRVLGPKETPERPLLRLFQDWAAHGGFPDGTIFHQHYDYSTELVDLIDAVPATTVTIIRDPYDAMVSLHHFVHAQAGATGDEADARRATTLMNRIVGKPIDHPDTLVELERL